MYDAIKQYNTPLCLSIYWLCVKNLLVSWDTWYNNGDKLHLYLLHIYLYKKPTRKPYKNYCVAVKSKVVVTSSDVSITERKSAGTITIYNAFFLTLDPSWKHGEFYAIHVLFIICVLSCADFYRIIAASHIWRKPQNRLRRERPICNFMRFCASRIVFHIVCFILLCVCVIYTRVSGDWACRNVEFLKPKSGIGTISHFCIVIGFCPEKGRRKGKSIFSFYVFTFHLFYLFHLQFTCILFPGLSFVLKFPMWTRRSGRIEPFVMGLNRVWNIYIFLIKNHHRMQNRYWK